MLAGHGPEYDSFVTSVTTRLEPISLDQLYGHLLSHKSRLKHHSSQKRFSEMPANISTKSSSGNGRGGRDGNGRGGYGRGFNPVVVVGATVVVTLVVVVELSCFLLKTALYVKCV